MKLTNEPIKEVRVKKTRVAAGLWPVRYADIDLDEAVRHYFLHGPTGHYHPKQFRVRFDDGKVGETHAELLDVGQK